MDGWRYKGRGKEDKQIKEGGKIKKYTCRVQVRENGALIEEFEGLLFAEAAYDRYESDDKDEGKFKPNFYEIVEYFYMNPPTGSVDTWDNWLHEQRKDGWGIEQMEKLVEVEKVNGEWVQK